MSGQCILTQILDERAACSADKLFMYETLLEESTNIFHNLSSTGRFKIVL